MSKTTNTMISALLAGLLLCTGCSTRNERHRKFGLTGAWTLAQIEFPTDFVRHYPNHGVTFCRIYTPDSCTYYCQLKSLWSNDTLELRAARDVIVIPDGQGTFTLTNLGGGQVLYLEDGESRLLTIVNDTTIIIQDHGIKQTWLRATQMTQSRINEIRNIIVSDEANDMLGNGETGRPSLNYVLATTERELKATNHTLVYVILALLAVLLVVAETALRFYRKKRRIEQQLRQISEEREHRPQPVRKAMKQVEAEFLSGDYYLGLRKRIVAGQRLRKDEWDELEQQLKPVYPGFTNHLTNLCRMSELEYRVCLLIKLRATPTEMAGVLSKDVSTISSTRSRLYQKVFQQKGSSRQWDDFILSLSDA